MQQAAAQREVLAAPTRVDGSVNDLSTTIPGPDQGAMIVTAAAELIIPEIESPQASKTNLGGPEVTAEDAALPVANSASAWQTPLWQPSIPAPESHAVSYKESFRPKGPPAVEEIEGGSVAVRPEVQSAVPEGYRLLRIPADVAARLQVL